MLPRLTALITSTFISLNVCIHEKYIRKYYVSGIKTQGECIIATKSVEKKNHSNLLLNVCAVLLFFLLVACEQQPAQTIPENTSLAEPEANVTPPCQDAENKDKCYFDESVRTSNWSMCYNINESSPKDLCLMRLAAETSDSSICSKVKSADNKDSCYFLMAAQMNDPGLCASITEANRTLFTRNICRKVAVVIDNTIEPEEAGPEVNFSATFNTSPAQDKLMIEEFDKLEKQWREEEKLERKMQAIEARKSVMYIKGEDWVAKIDLPNFIDYEDELEMPERFFSKEHRIDYVYTSALAYKVDVSDSAGCRDFFLKSVETISQLLASQLGGYVKDSQTSTMNMWGLPISTFQIVFKGKDGAAFKGIYAYKFVDEYCLILSMSKIDAAPQNLDVFAPIANSLEIEEVQEAPEGDNVYTINPEDTLLEE